MTNAPLSFAAALVIACAVGWVCYGRPAPAVLDVQRLESPGAAQQPSARDQTGSGASSKVPSVEIDPEWVSFPREQVVVRALMTIPAQLASRDIFRDCDLNPRDEFLRRAQRNQLAAGVDDYIARIHAADRVSATAAGRSRHRRALVEAVELTAEERAQAKRRGARVHKTLQTLLGGTGSETTPGGQSIDQVVAREVRNRKVTKLTAHTAGGEASASGTFSANALWVQAIRHREISVSLRIELFGLLTKRCLSLGVLTDEESKAVMSRLVGEIRIALTLETPAPDGR